jgi:serine O-acetyltransferase
MACKTFAQKLRGLEFSATIRAIPVWNVGNMPRYNKEQSLVKLLRIGYRLHTRKLTFVSNFMNFIIRLLYGCSIPVSIKLGKNVHFSHSGFATMIHGDSIIGDNCVIGTHVLLGGNTKERGVPIVEDDVTIHPYAMLVGPITIGRGAVIAAQSFVNRDVPAGSLVMGQPAKVVRTAPVADKALMPLR